MQGKTFHIIKKPHSKNYKPNCKWGKEVVRTMLKRRTFSQPAIDMLRAAGFEIIEDEYIEPKKKESTIDLPNAHISYNRSKLLWQGWWINPETNIREGDIIFANSKQLLLTALIAYELTIRNQQLIK